MHAPLATVAKRTLRLFVTNRTLHKQKKETFMLVSRVFRFRSAPHIRNRSPRLTKALWLRRLNLRHVPFRPASVGSYTLEYHAIFFICLSQQTASEHWVRIDMDRAWIRFFFFVEKINNENASAKRHPELYGISLKAILACIYIYIINW